MYRVKVQLDNGDVISVGVARLIIENTGENGDEEIHVVATDEGVVVDVIADDEVVATCCCDPEVLAEHAS